MKTRTSFDSDLTALVALVGTVVSGCQAGLSKLNVGKTAIISPQAVTVNAGQNFNLSMNFTPGPDAITSLQFDLLVPTNFTISSITAGSASLAAGKSLQSAQIQGGQRIIIFGLNQTAIGNGMLLTVSGTAGTSKGPFSLALTNIAGSKADGTTANLSAMSASITVQ